MENKVNFLEYNSLKQTLLSFLEDHKEFQAGYTTLVKLENQRNFHLGLVRLSFESSVSDHARKLASCCAKIFIKKNWGESFFELEEKSNIIQALFQFLTIDDYYYKNFISKILGIISKKELPNIYEGFLDTLLELLKNSQDQNIVDTFLRILINIINECDDRITDFTGYILPVIFHTFTNSQNQPKNQEKCMRILSMLLTKISSKEYSDQEFLSKSLEGWVYPWIGLFNTIIQTNPKFLLDIKKLTIRSIDILIRDLQRYFSQHIQTLILPVWKLILFELPLYTDVVIFHKKIEYNEDEENQIEEKNYLYERGIESDEEGEIYGVEGLITELTDLTIDLLKSKSILSAIKGYLQTFLLCIKGYCLLPHTSLRIWKNDPNLFISEEFDEENVNSIRSKALVLIKEITYEMEDDNILSFLKIIISELSEGINPDNYTEVLKLDDFNLINSYFDKMNSEEVYKIRRFEANLTILGMLSKDLINLKRKGKITSDECLEILNFLFNIISTKSEGNCFVILDKNFALLVGRAVWCVGRMLELFTNDEKILQKIFQEITICIQNYKGDLTISLIACKCLTRLCTLLKDQGFDSEGIVENFKNIIEIMRKTNEDTLLFPIQTVNSLSKLNTKRALYVPLNHSSVFMDIYSKYYNHQDIGIEILTLIKLWCDDPVTAKILLKLFIPFAMFVFEDFYRTLSSPEKENFEEIKKTVMTSHGNQDLEVRTSISMLPVNMMLTQNLIEIIGMLMKFCVDTKDTDNLHWIGLIVNIICDIIIKTDDVEILRKSLILLKLYIPLCKEVIDQKNQRQLIINVINKFFAPTMMESSMLYVGNVITQYFAHVSTKVETDILDAVVRKIYRSRMPSIVQSLVLVYSRLIIKHPNEILSFLSQVSIENRAGLKVLIDKWLLHLPRFSGKYYINVSLKAITLMYSLKNQLIESLMVIGYDPSHSTASVEVNAPLKILSTLIRCLNNEIKAEQMKNKKNDYSALELENLEKEMYSNKLFDETNDNNKEEGKNHIDEEENKKLDVDMNEFKNLDAEDQIEINSKLHFINLQGKSGGLSNIETGSEIYLSQMIGFDYNDIDAEEDDTNEDDLYMLKDIDYDFVLKDYLIDFFKKNLATDTEYLKECLKLLPRADQEMFKNFNL